MFEGVPLVVFGFCIATANSRCESSTSRNIFRYRGSKMNSGSITCGNRIAFGSVMTGTSDGRTMNTSYGESSVIQANAVPTRHKGDLQNSYPLRMFVA